MPDETELRYRREAAALGRRLRDIRTARGLTQEAAAAMAHVAPRHLQRAEAGSNLCLLTLVRLASAYGVTTVQFFEPGWSECALLAAEPE